MIYVIYSLAQPSDLTTTAEHSMSVHLNTQTMMHALGTRGANLA